MPRPHACRRISEPPRFTCFKPRGVPLSALETVRLGLDEFEAVRLADLEGLYQEEAAERMGVSRQTFGNIVTAARRKIADALVNGKALTVEGGNVTMTAREFLCLVCGHGWTLSFGEPRPETCPGCGSDRIHRNWPGPAEDRGGPQGNDGRQRRCGGGGGGKCGGRRHRGGQ